MTTVTDRMNPLDALFLHAEDGTTHMHIGSAAIFEGPAPALADLALLLERKLPRLPRYRQRVRFVPGDLGHPVWVDAADFDLGRHLRHTALPAPGGDAELEHLMGRLMAQELDRTHPLWEAWLVDGLAGGRWAMVSKVHHCMVDGISGTDLMATLLDPSPTAETPPAEPWTPTAEPPGLALAAEAAIRAAWAPARWALAQAAAPWAAVRRMSAGLGSLVSTVSHGAPRTSITGTIGPHRRWSAAQCDLADLKAIGLAAGGSINDVALSITTAAFRELLVGRGEMLPHDLVLRTLVPVSVRPPDDHSPNNQVSLIIAELPVGIADPIERLQWIIQRMAQHKASHEADAAATVFRAADLLPPVLVARGIRALVAAMHRLPQHVVDTVTTNVPGPRHPLYALGREMVAYLPFVPIAEGVRIGVAIMSYHGRMSFGITGDRDTVPDLHVMTQQITAEVAMLRSTTRAR